jgi:hypothetical protein
MKFPIVKLRQKMLDFCFAYFSVPVERRMLAVDLIPFRSTNK